jgi:hypothetical protein
MITLTGCQDGLDVVKVATRDLSYESSARIGEVETRRKDC